MELSLQTFLWLRDKGSLSSRCAVPMQGTPSMVQLTPEGLHEIASGVPMVKVLNRYCCSRFDMPESLLPLSPSPVAPNTAVASKPTIAAGSNKRYVSVEAARIHNWNAVRTICRDALGHDLPESQLQSIQHQGDTLEALLLIKRVFELLAAHRDAEKRQKCEQQKLMENPLQSDVKRLLTTKSVASSKSIPSHLRAGRSPSPATKKP